MLESLAGRWVTTIEGDDGSEGLVIIDKDGSLTFVGEDGGDSETKLAEAEPGSAHQLVLISEEGEQLCTATLEKKAGDDTLRLEGADGYVEIWHRTSSEDGKPKVVARRPSASRVTRVWTKEGQLGSPKPEASDGAGRRSGAPGKSRGQGNKWDFTSPEAELIKLKFMEFDACGDGMLAMSELGEILKQGRPDMSDEEVALLFQEVDKDRVGRISFDAFVEYLFSQKDE
mmetsp:Transcript_32062/g.92096  ORF Transcript_32062/g.92096 Transcript_32062/m.92096 type:complete len:229 (-) Transcript_32062:69-755(-)